MKYQDTSEEPDDNGAWVIPLVAAFMLSGLLGYALGHHDGAHDAYKEAEASGCGYYKREGPIPEWGFVWKQNTKKAILENP